MISDLNAYSPEVSGEFPASPFSPKQLDITLVLCGSSCFGHRVLFGHSWQRTLALETRVRTLVLVATREVNARAGGEERGGRSVVLATRADACAGDESGGVLVLATNARAGNKSCGLSC